MEATVSNPTTAKKLALQSLPLVRRPSRIHSLMPLLCHVLFFLLVSINGIQSIRSTNKIAESSKPLPTTPDSSSSTDPEAESLVSNPICNLPKDRGTTIDGCPKNGNGTTASNGSGTKWYFDMETLQCLAFGFKGCGGNANRFDTVFECQQECRLPADYGGCVGRKPPANNAKGEQIFCAGPDGKEKCPSGYVCQMLAFYGVCCDAKDKEMYGRNYRPKCANGKQVHQLMDTHNNWPLIVLGKSCTDQFCPDQMDCVGQEIFAHCCPK